MCCTANDLKRKIMELCCRGKKRLDYFLRTNNIQKKKHDRMKIHYLVHKLHKFVHFTRTKNIQ